MVPAGRFELQRFPVIVSTKRAHLKYQYAIQKTSQHNQVELSSLNSGRDGRWGLEHTGTAEQAATTTR